MAGRLSDQEIDEALAGLAGGWQRAGEALVLDAEFDDFPAALDRLNAIAALAEDAGHHPDLHLHSWNRLHVSISTHSEGGLTSLDVDLATAIAGLPD